MQIPDFEAERYFDRFGELAEHILCASDCETLTVAELLKMGESADQELGALELRYTEFQGGRGLREAIAGLYRDIDADDVLVHTGAQEALFTLMTSFLDPGDHLVVHAPAYQPAHAVAAAQGVEVSFWEAREEEGWRLDLDDLQRKISPRTRAIFLNCPHNPTGYLMDRSDYLALVRLAEERGVVLLSDEVYRGLEHDPAHRLPAACEVSPQAVSIGDLSKAHGLPGLRIGWIATRSPEVRRRVVRLKDYLTICNSAPSELLARIAVGKAEELADRSRERVVANLDRADAFFESHPTLFGWDRPAAGSTAFPRFLGGSAEDFCERAAREAGVMLLPSTTYGAGDAHIRFGFGRRDFSRGLDALSEFLVGGRGG